MKTFEQRLERLEAISAKMKEQGIPLHESLSLFEEGITLSKELEKELAGIEQRVQLLVSSPNGPGQAPEFKTFDEDL